MLGDAFGLQGNAGRHDGLSPLGKCPLSVILQHGLERDQVSWFAGDFKGAIAISGRHRQLESQRLHHRPI
jgi:hypothetical protein